MGFTHDERQVEANLFNENGKWKYTVALDYTNVDWDSLDLWSAARMALRDATERGTSGAPLRRIPEGWSLVVLEPYAKNSFPIMVRAKRED